MTNQRATHHDPREPMISPDALGLLGGGKIAYVRIGPLRGRCGEQFPQAPVARTGHLTLRPARGRADADPAHRTAASRHRQRASEPGARDRQRALRFLGSNPILGHCVI